MTNYVLPRREFLALLGAAAPLAAFGLGARADSAAELNFGFQQTSWGTIGMIAEARDLFKKAGANVKIYKFDSGKTTRDAMISGRIDIGVIGATPFVVGAAKGQMEAIATAMYGAKTLSVVGGLKSGVNSVKDLKGRRVGSQLGSATDSVFQNKILPRFALSKSDIQIINIPFQNHVSALAAGSIDAFAGVEPFPSVAEVEKIGKVLVDYSDFDLQPIILAANKSVVDTKRDAVVAFLRGWLAGVKLFNEHRAEASQIVLKYFKGQGFAVNEKIISLMLSKIDVNPNYVPQLSEYLNGEANELLRHNNIQAVPDWTKLLDRKLLAAAEVKA